MCIGTLVSKRSGAQGGRGAWRREEGRKLEEQVFRGDMGVEDEVSPSSVQNRIAALQCRPLPISDTKTGPFLEGHGSFHEERSGMTPILPKSGSFWRRRQLLKHRAPIS